ncbi:MAG: hydrogenase iron-sulfur subunit, partial [Candidatus Hodarchaeales archaeon]
HLDMILSKGTVEKKFPTAEIDNDKCTLCELCVTACPFGAIDVIPVANPGIKMQVDPISCLGCGQCVSTCPASAIVVDYYSEDIILKQLEGLLYDAKDNPDPLIITFACWECAYSATDASGMAVRTLPSDHKMAPGTYDHTVRILPVQCTGNISARLIQKTFAMGADGILVLGCYEDKCHYDSGSQASTIRVALLKQMLQFSGIDPQRLEKETTFFMSCDRFDMAAKKMARKLKKLGKLDR